MGLSHTYSKSTRKGPRDLSKKALAYKQFLEGMVFLKYGTFGYPKQKHVYFDGSAIRWRANTKEGHKKLEKSGEASKNKGKFIDLSDANADYQY